MQIQKINSLNEPLFFEYVKNREIEFFFYLMDYKQYPENTQLFLAIDEQQNIVGLFIIWRNRTIQLRGTVEAADKFIKYLKREQIDVNDITGTIDHQQLIEREFPNPKLKFNMYRMYLEKGKEQLYEQFSYVPLGQDQKEEIAAFLRHADPIFFGSHQAEDIIMDENHPYFGIMEGEILTALVGLWVDKSMGIINVVATHPDYRKQGRAASIVSTGVKWLFEQTNKIIIHVRTANTPAIKTYQKVGYNILFEYVVHSNKG